MSIIKITLASEFPDIKRSSNRVSLDILPRFRVSLSISVTVVGVLSVGWMAPLITRPLQRAGHYMQRIR